jgi:DNA-binding NarL/FixJ family response regulator
VPVIKLATAGRCPHQLDRVLRDRGVLTLGQVDTVDKLDRLAARRPDVLVCFADDTHDGLTQLIHGVAGRWFTVVVAARDWPYLHSIIRAGADAYLVRRNPEDCEALVAMITAAVPAQPAVPERGTLLDTLSQREREALGYVAAGYTHQQTATRMRVTKSTVDTFIGRIRTKLGVGNKAELAALALLPQAQDPGQAPAGGDQPIPLCRRGPGPRHRPVASPVQPRHDCEV